MKTATRKQFLNELAKYPGATFEEEYFSCGIVSVDAPDGYYWSNYPELTCLMGYWWREFKGSKGEMYADFIERMSAGITKLNSEE